MISLKNAVFQAFFSYKFCCATFFSFCCISRLICSYLVFAVSNYRKKLREENLWESAFWNSYFCLKMVVLLSVFILPKIQLTGEASGSIFLQFFLKSNFAYNPFAYLYLIGI